MYEVDNHGSPDGPFIINRPWYGDISAEKQIKNKLVNLIETVFDCGDSDIEKFEIYTK